MALLQTLARRTIWSRTARLPEIGLRTVMRPLVRFFPNARGSPGDDGTVHVSALAPRSLTRTSELPGVIVAQQVNELRLHERLDWPKETTLFPCASHFDRTGISTP